jgi:hypothetical protein
VLDAPTRCADDSFELVNGPLTSGLSGTALGPKSVACGPGDTVILRGEVCGLMPSGVGLHRLEPVERDRTVSWSDVSWDRLRRTKRSHPTTPLCDVCLFDITSNNGQYGFHANGSDNGT